MAVSGKRRTRSKLKAVTWARRARGGSGAAKRAPHALPPKLTAPRPTRLYRRKRLFDLLDRARADLRVIWVSAPAGTGKTSLAVSYLEARKLPVLWYQVDQGDGDIASFFYYLGLAAKRAAPRFKRPLPLLAPEFLGDVPTFTRNFFRELYRRLPRKSVLVLDDYQDAPEASPLHDVLHVAMAEVPDDLHLLVLSRSEPPARVARLRLSDQVASLGWDEMRLTPAETAGLSAARLGDKSASRTTIRRLHDRTQGWAAGVVLLLEQGRADDRHEPTRTSSDQRLLFDYFAGEIFDRSAPPVPEFLLKTALLPRVTVSAARQLTRVEQSGEILADLTTRNYFTVRHAGPSEDSYEYHPLFREFLRTRARTAIPPEEQRQLLYRAAGWLVQNGQPEAAFQLLLESGDVPRTIEVILAHAPALAAQGRLTTLDQWLGAVPAAAIEKSPWLEYWRGACIAVRDPRAARAYFERAYVGFQDVPEALGLYLAWAGVVEALLYEFDDFSSIDRWMAEIDALLPRHPLEQFPEAEARVVHSALTLLNYARPDVPELPRWAARAEALLERLRGSPWRLIIASGLHRHYLWIGDLPRVRDLVPDLKREVAASDTEALPRLSVFLGLATSAWLLGDLAWARRWLEQANDFSAQQGVGVLRPFLHSSGVWASAAEDDEAGVRRFIAGGRAALEGPPGRLHLSHYFYYRSWLDLKHGDLAAARQHGEQALALAETVTARFLVALIQCKLSEILTECGEYEAAHRHLARAADFAERACNRLIAVMADLSLAYAHAREGRRAEGLEALTRSWGLARQLGFSVYPNANRRMEAELCRLALESDVEPDYIRRLIRQRHFAPPSEAAVPETWPFPLRLYSFGQLSVVVEDEPLSRSPAHKRPLALLEALVAQGGHEVPEAQLIEALWPDAEGDAAARNLKVNLHRLRRLLPDHALIWSDGKLSLDPARVWVDRWALEQSLTRLDRSNPSDSTSSLAAQVTHALQIYRGEFLAGNVASWALSARERLRNKTLRVVTRSAEAIDRRDPAAAVPIYEMAIEIDPVRESLYQGLLRCHHALRQPSEGLRVYRRVRDVLKRELGLPPAAATEALRSALEVDR